MHPGAKTSQIIDVYINTIKVLRVIDPSDRLLDVVTDPVRTYIRGRSGTARCIITSLTDEEAGGDLYEELRRQDARRLEQEQLDSDDETEPPDLEWVTPRHGPSKDIPFCHTTREGAVVIFSACWLAFTRVKNSLSMTTDSCWPTNSLPIWTTTLTRNCTCWSF
jgi:hypothetical protein